MLKEDKPDRFEVAAGAQKLVFKTVIQALVEHASASDPGLRDRIIATIEAYITTLGPQSELQQDFAERARASVMALVRPSA